MDLRAAAPSACAAKAFPPRPASGDLLATVRIALPEKSDADLEALMKKWQSNKAYDPRKEM